MYVIVDTTRYGMDLTDEEIADCAEEHGLFENREEAVIKAKCLPIDPDHIMLVDIECEGGLLQ